MNIVANALFFAALIFPVTSYGFEVKGLQLGQVTSHQELANLFGNAECSSDIKDIKLFGIYCAVPISYLGIKTSARVKMDKQWMVEFIEIKIPYELLPQVETYLTKQYGKPDVIRKAKRIMQGYKNVADGSIAPPFTYSEPCSDWRNLEQVTISACERDILGPNSHLTFFYKPPKILDETDT